MDKETLDQQYWDLRYQNQQTGWDIGGASTPLIEYLKQVKNKNLKILIPGCGNAHEVDEMLKMGFTNITLIDISPTLCNQLKKKYSNSVEVICGDFFQLNGQYDLILEQTFFCALKPHKRKDYINKMRTLLKDGGKLVGLLFNTQFDSEGPPFGGNIEEYQNLFQGNLSVKCMEECHNSIQPRKGKEAFFIVQN